MTARRTVAALLGLSLLLASCSEAGSADKGGGATRTSASTRTTAPAPSPSDPSTTAGATGAGRNTAAPIGVGWGPSRVEIRRAQRIAHRMPLSHLAGQVIVAQYDGHGAPSAQVNGLHLGGVIVMAENIGSTEALRASNRALQASARQAGRRWPVFIGVDQEGGIVERVKDRATRFPTFMSAGAAGNPRLTSRAAAASGAELVNLGFSVVFAPDSDVTSGPDDPTIGSRSASSRPGVVARQMNAAVDGYLSAGILPVIKHFPGHGSVPADSHVELPVQRKTLRQLRASDLVPFRAGVSGGMAAVMVGHIDVRAVDPRMPSSLSRKVVTGLLRRDLGFQGLAVTDALNMGAVTNKYSSGEAAVRALNAGEDVLLMPPSPSAARDAIVRAVQGGSLSRARLEQAAARQIAVLLHQHDLKPALTRKPGTSGRESYRLSAGAATMASGPCRGRLVGRSVLASGPSDAVARFNAAAAKAGLRTGSGTRVALVGYGGGGRRSDVVVTMDTPYALGSSSTRVAKIAMYGDTAGAMRALVQVLLGKARAPGRLPVPVKGVQRPGCP
ncbi:MAG TPA: glycoside hydrolase family 3 N-terminal domain-containing protein [Nocardioidaceae bacterium]|nr:glycoside hydrolase family 3 N-terminal domain-containing protein [Nocardioidaceae bacterium]